MRERIHFHISDILTLTSELVLSVPEKAPIDASGTQWAGRKHRIDGLVQLIEFVTGADIGKRLNPHSGSEQFDAHDLLVLAPIAEEALRAQPQVQAALSKIDSVPDFRTIPNEAQRDDAIATWFRELEERHGCSYVEVEAPDKRHAIAEAVRIKQRKFPATGPSLN
jgi:hypothetical protein